MGSALGRAYAALPPTASLSALLLTTTSPPLPSCSPAPNLASPSPVAPAQPPRSRAPAPGWASPLLSGASPVLHPCPASDLAAPGPEPGGPLGAAPELQAHGRPVLGHTYACTAGLMLVSLMGTQLWLHHADMLDA